MNWPELHDTLTQLVSAFDPPEGSGLVLDRAEVAIPLEATTRYGPGGLVIYARAPHSRWRAGVLPETQLAFVTIERDRAIEGGVG